MSTSAPATPLLAIGDAVHLTSGPFQIRLNSSRRLRCAHGVAMLTMRAGASVWNVVLFEGDCYNGQRAGVLNANPLYGACTLVLERRTVRGQVSADKRTRVVDERKPLHVAQERSVAYARS